ncbi:MAG: efflux RND transporter permease subunit [Rhodospirillaceae bacterium]|nr:efflux RND transporter permease subunit [Rhodospirillaceae bacterium]
MSFDLSGTITRTFIRSPLTPLLLLAALIAGTLALVSLPREEEPQISVPMVDLFVEANGLRAADAVELVTEPLEDILSAIDGVEHVYTNTYDDRVVATARFEVGTDEDDAILRVHENVRANYDRMPLGIPEPLIVGRGINDVAILVLTVYPDPAVADRWTDNDLYQLAEELLLDLRDVEDVGNTYIVGGRPDQIRVEPDPERLSLYGVTLNQLVEKIENANRSFNIGSVRQDGDTLTVVAGQTLQGVPDIGLLLLTSYDGRPVYVRDVADVVVDAEPVDARVWQVMPANAEGEGGDEGAAGETVRVPAVSIAIAKRAGANAVDIAHEVRARLAELQSEVVPDGIHVEITRDYGETANEKVNELLTHLVLATVVIVLLIVLAVGWREAVVLFVVVPTTILLTLFASWLLGYTINRVSLFALIFSIGILVDDAIVVVENIARHWAMRDGRPRLQSAVEAVREVGNPTVIATLTIVAALLPMMFVSGLMGPYMSPIPANASAAMVFSFFVAVIVTPWLMVHLRRRHQDGADADGRGHGHGGHADGIGPVGRVYLKVARPLVRGRLRSGLFLAIVAGLTLASMVLIYTRDVTVKLLPFDDKSELQVVIDLPEGASLEDTERVLLAATDVALTIPEVVDAQVFAGTSMPFNFNGLVRHYFLRQSPELGDIQVNLLPRGERDRASHDVALDLRTRLADLAVPEGTVVRVVEVPPGPPVLSTLLAEVYGPDADTRRETARQVRAVFEEVPYIVDVDDSFGRPADRLRFAIDQDNLEFLGVEQQAVYDTLAALMGGVSVGYSHRGEGRDPIEIAVRLPLDRLQVNERLLATPVPSAAGIVELGEVVDVTREPSSYPIFRRNGRFVEMVMGELAGAYEAPIYGMLAVEDALAERGLDIDVRLHGQPAYASSPILLWDGEWEITYVTFRDMGAAFAVAILAIYLLVVGQFSSFKLPLVILSPVPLTLVGIFAGHWLLGAPFTATSMIGFIALAGIVVRNSILLVDFIRHRRDADVPLRAVLLEAGAIRITPILLTAAAAMVGAAFILVDPIFQGLAISLLFGLASSTLLTVLVIPAIYVLLRDDHRPLEEPAPREPAQAG